ncbi:MAG: amidohydrolase [Chloroflexi bacterium]|nr:amidohydrolase [Chloroflexota bacterium]
MDNHRIISADSHVAEPQSLYQERVPKEYRDRVPHTETRNGGQYWVVEGKRPRRIDLAKKRATEEDQVREFRLDPSGGRDIQHRLADQEKDGVTAEVIYPNESLFIFVSKDPGYQIAMARSYNDWAMELFGSHLDHFIPSAMIPVIDIPAAIEEAKRVAKLGYKIICAPLLVEKLPYSQPEYDPFWSTLEDEGLVLSLHAFAEDTDTYESDIGEEEGTGGAVTYMVLSMADGQDPVTRLITSGAVQRHPDLKFVVVECGAGWLAWLLYALDEQIEKKHMWNRPVLEMKPSEFMRRQGHVTFGDDPVGLSNLGFTGPEPLLWGSDYPHDEGTFPYSQQVIERTFKGVSQEDKWMIIGGNAERLYRL